ncbi:MAG TPA: hypothetical protein VE445_07970 [Nitrososphaeraceae archaeon]|jgi:hypothetical protein|nr:hypothetical protein [Nitrososphaeraceae archaeon]
MVKVFSLLREFVDVGGKSKFCVNCGNMATQEALFNVDGAMLIEKYCDTCAVKEQSKSRKISP